MIRHLASLLLIAAGLFAARAQAETLLCTPIDALPAVISSGGTYCLGKDLGTAVGTGAAITINANNVTLDCNGHKLGGAAAGIGTQAVGIYAYDRSNTTIRNCMVRGFMWGVGLFGNNGGGHLVADNRFDGNTYTAIYVSGDGSTIRDNLIFSTGGGTSGGGWTQGIESQGDNSVIGNTIWGMTPVASRNDAQGITIGNNTAGMVAGNRVSGLAGEFNLGIRLYDTASRVRLVDNSFDASTWIVYCDVDGGAVMRDNILSGGSVDSGCTDAGGNFDVP
jgi:hypothetical protein